MFAYIPASLFSGEYVLLYSAFGLNFANNDGFEEWALRERGEGIPPIPEPASMLLFGSGLVAWAGLRRRFKK